jgi:hypothetical protein
MCLFRQITAQIWSLTLCRCTIASTAKVALVPVRMCSNRPGSHHGPNTGPKSTDTVVTGKNGGDLDVHGVLKAQLVPRLDHARLEVEVVDRLLGHGDDQVATLGGDSAWVVPFKVTGGLVKSSGSRALTR